MESQPVATAFSRKSISIPFLSAGHITPEQRWTQTINDNVAERQFYGLSHMNRLKDMLLTFMISPGVKRLDGEKAAIGLQANSMASFVIDDPLQIGECFLEKSLRFTKTELREITY